MRQLTVPCRWLSLLAVSLSCGFWTAAAAAQSPTPATVPTSDKTLRVGSAKIDITPPFPIWLNGYAARTEPARSASQPIHARALAIDDPQTLPAVLIAFDGLGVSQQIVAAVADRLLESHQLPAERLAICATHTHNGPFLPDVAPVIFGRRLPESDDRQSTNYRQALIDKLTAVAQQALDRLEPGTLSWSTGRVEFAQNRRTPGGPVDHRLPVLIARSADGRVLSVLATYACHCTTLGAEANVVHGDWAGVAAATLESKYPDCVAMITIGCGADANPAPRTGIELAERHGQSLAAEVDRLLTANQFRPVSKGPDCRSSIIGLPYDAPSTIDQWREKIDEPKFEGYRAQLQVARYNAEGSLPSDLQYRIVTWSFGDDLAMIFLPGEVVVDYALRIVQEYDPDRVWVHAYANDAPCYIPSRRIRLEGGYEGGGAMVYYNQPAPLVPECEDLIMDTIQRLTPHRFYGEKLRERYPAPVAPSASVAAMDVHEAMEVQLVASEPLIRDPVAFDWSPDGRLWVVEMHDYPLGIGPDGAPGGRVVVLDDDNGDGVYDRSSVFADGLTFPSGIKVWRDGVLVSVAPDVLWLRDTDGDGRSDETRPVLHGFAEGNPQHRANGLRWGIDNWLYLGIGDGSDVIEADQDQLSVRGRDLRMRPEGPGRLEAQSGQTQFGRTQNDWGEWFGNDNSNPLWHYVLDDHYLRRNPFVQPPAVKRDVPEQAGIAPVYPASRTLERFNDLYAANRFTSACSPEIYRDILLGESFYGNAFVCEPVHNLIHREVVSEDGLSYRSRRAPEEEQREFLASRDNWCRPVMVRTGPDGALWFADMYRYVIEHTTWIPADFQRRMDVRAGSDQGRIYRVYPRNRQPRDWPNLTQLSRADLIRQLESPNGWIRDMVQQMVLWQPQPDDKTLLTELVLHSSSAAARLQAMYTLAGLQQLDTTILAAALKDSHPEVTRHAVRLSESRLDQQPTLLAAVGELARQSEIAPRLRLQLAYSLGESKSELATQRLAELLLAAHDSSELLAAASSSLGPHNIGPVLQQVLAMPPDAVDLDVVRQVASIGWRLTPEQAAAQLLPALAPAPGSDREAWQIQLLAHLIQDLPPDDSDPYRSLRKTVSDQRPAAARLAADPAAKTALRIDACGLLADSLAQHPEDFDRLVSLIQSRDTAPELQRAAMDGILSSGAAEQLERVIRLCWPTLSPPMRGQLLEQVLGRAETSELFLHLVRDEAVPATDVPTLYRQRLLESADLHVRQEAQQLLVDTASQNRQELVNGYMQRWQLPGDTHSGAKLFEKHCSACHRLGTVGQAVGPDLAALSDRSPLTLATAVLDPNRAVDDKYIGFIVETQQGQQISGLVQQETSNQLVVMTPNGQTQAILKSDLAALRATGKSFMPEGFEQELSPSQLADLVTFVRSYRPPSKEYENHEPQLVKADAAGVLKLSADQSYIYGGRLIFEQKHKNLGWWEREGDYAVWEVNVPTAGTYRIQLEYACDDDSAGAGFAVLVGDQKAIGQTSSTGSWDRYSEFNAGSIELPAGLTDVTVTNSGPIRRELFDLRSVTLELERSKE